MSLHFVGDVSFSPFHGEKVAEGRMRGGAMSAGYAISEASRTI